MKRYALNLVKELLAYFPCVAITGVRQCGKTTLINQLPKEWKIFDLEKGDDFDLISRDTDLFFRLNSNFVALDEAQLQPSIFPALRVPIDANRSKKGRFIITGSSSVDLLSSISESLAGRVAIVEMSPLTMREAFEKPQAVVYDLIANKKLFRQFNDLKPTNMTIKQQHQYWLRGGYPELWTNKSKRFHKLWMQNYMQTYLSRDIMQLFPGLNRQKYRLFINMLGHLSGSVINYSQVARSLGVSQPTVRDYFNIIDGTFIWRNIPAYEKNATKRIIKHPKGYLRDSGILNHLLHLNDIDDVLAHPSMGHSWEAMVIENVIRGLKNNGVDFDYYYYRTGTGSEVDLILEGEFGLLPIEIKHAQNVKLRDIRGIQNFIKDYQCDYGVVISNTSKPVYINENLINLPFSYF
jgi:predicted AAA+ superfamily ATPase